MREILFKAKRVDNLEWVEGDLIQEKDLDITSIICWNYYNGENGLEREPFEYQVYPSTVCQYTGLKDENGNKIFEYDVVSLKENGEPEGIIEYGSWNCGCCYDVYGFSGVSKKGICDKKITLYHGENERVGIYVVGNIHDEEE